MTLDALIILLGFQLAGEVIARTLNLPLPGPVIGMLLLFAVLLLRRGVSVSLERTSQQLLGYLPLLFVPAGTGVIVHLGLLSAQWPVVLAALLGSTAAAMLTTAYTVRLLAPRRRR